MTKTLVVIIVLLLVCCCVSSAASGGLYLTGIFPGTQPALGKQIMKAQEDKECPKDTNFKKEIQDVKESSDWDKYNIFGTFNDLNDSVISNVKQLCSLNIATNSSGTDLNGSGTDLNGSGAGLNGSGTGSGGSGGSGADLNGSGTDLDGSGTGSGTDLEGSGAGLNGSGTGSGGSGGSGADLNGSGTGPDNTTQLIKEMGICSSTDGCELPYLCLATRTNAPPAAGNNWTPERKCMLADDCWTKATSAQTVPDDACYPDDYFTRNLIEKEEEIVRDIYGCLNGKVTTITLGGAIKEMTPSEARDKNDTCGGSSYGAENDEDMKERIRQSCLDGEPALLNKCP